MNHLILGFWCLMGISFCLAVLYIGIVLYREEKIRNGR